MFRNWINRKIESGEYITTSVQVNRFSTDTNIPLNHKGKADKSVVLRYKYWDKQSTYKDLSFDKTYLNHFYLISLYHQQNREIVGIDFDTNSETYQEFVSSYIDSDIADDEVEQSLYFSPHVLNDKHVGGHFYFQLANRETKEYIHKYTSSRFEEKEIDFLMAKNSIILTHGTDYKFDNDEHHKQYLGENHYTDFESDSTQFMREITVLTLDIADIKFLIDNEIIKPKNDKESAKKRKERIENGEVTENHIKQSISERYTPTSVRKLRYVLDHIPANEYKQVASWKPILYATVAFGLRNKIHDYARDAFTVWCMNMDNFTHKIEQDKGFFNKVRIHDEFDKQVEKTKKRINSNKNCVGFTHLIGEAKKYYKNVDKYNTNLLLEFSYTPDRVENSERVSSFYEEVMDHKLTTILAPMGGAKTERCFETIQNCKSVIKLGFRISETNEFVSKYNQFKRRKDKSFVNYQSFESTISVNKEQRIVIQFEALKKLIIDTQTIDLLIIDEYESILSQYDPNSTIFRNTKRDENGKTLLENVQQKFLELLRKSKHVLLMDALLKDSSIRIVENYLDVKAYKIENRFLRYRGKKFTYVNEYNNNIMLLSRSIRKNERIMVVCHSNIDTKIIHKYIIENLEVSESKVLLYNGNVSDEVKNEHYSNLNKYWDKADVVIYNTTILAGLNYNKERFDKIFAFFNNSGTINYIASLQMLFRNRRFKECYINFRTVSHMSSNIDGITLFNGASQFNDLFNNLIDFMGYDQVNGLEDDLIEAMLKSNSRRPYYSIKANNKVNEMISKLCHIKAINYYLEKGGAEIVSLNDTYGTMDSHGHVLSNSNYIPVNYIKSAIGIIRRYFKLEKIRENSETIIQGNTLYKNERIYEIEEEVDRNPQDKDLKKDLYRIKLAEKIDFNIDRITELREKDNLDKNELKEFNKLCNINSLTSYAYHLSKVRYYSDISDKIEKILNSFKFNSTVRIVDIKMIVLFKTLNTMGFWDSTSIFSKAEIQSNIKDSKDILLTLINKITIIEHGRIRDKKKKIDEVETTEEQKIDSEFQVFLKKVNSLLCVLGLAIKVHKVNGRNRSKSTYKFDFSKVLSIRDFCPSSFKIPCMESIDIPTLINLISVYKSI